MNKNYLLYLSLIFFAILITNVEEQVSLSNNNKIYTEIENSSAYEIVNIKNESDVLKFIELLKVNKVSLFFKELDGISVIGNSTDYLKKITNEKCEISKIKIINNDLSKDCHIKYYLKNNLTIITNPSITNEKVGYTKSDVSNIPYLKLKSDLIVPSIHNKINLSSNLKILLIILSVSFIASFLIDLENKRKEIIVLYYLGYTNFKIYQKVILINLIKSFTFSLCIILILNLIWERSIIYLTSVIPFYLGYSLIILIIIIILTTITVILIFKNSYRNYKINNYIVQKVLVYCAKVMCILVIISQTNFIFSAFDKIEEYENNKYLVPLSNYTFIKGASYSTKNLQEKLFDYSKVEQTDKAVNYFFYSVSENSNNQIVINLSSNIKNILGEKLELKDLYLLPEYYNLDLEKDIKLNLFDINNVENISGNLFIENKQNFYQQFLEITKNKITVNDGLIISSIGEEFENAKNQLILNIKIHLRIVIFVFVIYLVNLIIEIFLILNWRKEELKVKYRIGYSIVTMLKGQIYNIIILYTLPLIVFKISDPRIVAITFLMGLVQFFIEHKVYSFQINKFNRESV